MFRAAPLGADYKRLVLLHPDCVTDGVVDASEFPGIAERDSTNSSGDKIFGFEFGANGAFTALRVKELKRLLKAEGKESEGLIAVNLKMADVGILHFLNIRYDLKTLVTNMFIDPINICQ